MEEKDFAMEAIVERMEEMKLEIAALKEALAAKTEEVHEEGAHFAQGHHGIDLGKIRIMLEEGFEKVTETLRPLVEKAGRKISEPTRAAMAKAEEKIAVNPLMAVAVALGAGFIIGKICTIATHCYHYHYEEDEEE